LKWLFAPFGYISGFTGVCYPS